MQKLAKKRDDCPKDSQMCYDASIFTSGEVVGVIGATSFGVAQWVKEIANKTKTKLDWCFRPGKEQEGFYIFFLGSPQQRELVLKAMEDNQTPNIKSILFFQKGKIIPTRK